MKHQKKKDTQLLVTKLAEKILDLCNAKERYQSFVRNKNIKLVKQSKIITQQPKSVESPNVVGIKLVFIEHLKTSHIIFNIISQAEKVP